MSGKPRSGKPMKRRLTAFYRDDAGSSRALMIVAILVFVFCIVFLCLRISSDLPHDRDVKENRVNQSPFRGTG